MYGYARIRIGGKVDPVRRTSRDSFERWEKEKEIERRDG